MNFTVNRAAGFCTDAEFETSALLLRRRGIDLGNLPRSPEPGTRNHWLYVWSSRQDAERFAEELNRFSRGEGWVVQPVEAPPSEGPLGPLIIQAGRRSNGLVLGLHPLSRGLIQTAYPRAKPHAATIRVPFGTWDEFRKTYGSFEGLAERVLPTLTGLDREELASVGYAMLDDETEQTLLFVRPGDLAHA